MVQWNYCFFFFFFLFTSEEKEKKRQDEETKKKVSLSSCDTPLLVTNYPDTLLVTVVVRSKVYLVYNIFRVF